MKVSKQIEHSSWAVTFLNALSATLGISAIANLCIVEKRPVRKSYLVLHSIISLYVVSYKYLPQQSERERTRMKSSTVKKFSVTNLTSYYEFGYSSRWGVSKASQSS